MTQYTQLVHLVDHTVRTHGRIDVILNNAGIMPYSPLERRKMEDWEHTIDVNLKGTLYGISAALPHMRAQNSGHIINVSSVARHKVRPGTPPARRPHGIRVAGGRRVEAPGDRHGGGGSRECRGQAPCSLSGSDSW